MTLDDCAIEAGTDKASWGHGYGPHYERHFALLRDLPIDLLEVGIGVSTQPDRPTGAGLAMWSKWISSGLSSIVGIDVDPEALDVDSWALHDGRVQVFLADGRTWAPYRKFDIIIDDGSHEAADQQATWENLWPCLVNGGWYAIEDLTCPVVAAESVGHVALAGEMVDRALRFDRDVHEVHVYPELLLMRKKP